MNDRSRRYIEAGQRCRQWIADNVALISVGSLFETKCTALTACVNDLETLAGEYTAFTAEGLSATDVKGSERLDRIGESADREAGDDTGICMGLGRRVFGLRIATCLAARLGDLLGARLRLLEISRDRQQDLAGVVAQRLMVQRLAAMRHRRGKFVPSQQDLVRMIADEVGKPHGWTLLVAKGR